MTSTGHRHYGAPLSTFIANAPLCPPEKDLIPAFYNIEIPVLGTVLGTVVPAINDGFGF